MKRQINRLELSQLARELYAEKVRYSISSDALLKDLTLQSYQAAYIFLDLEEEYLDKFLGDKSSIEYIAKEAAMVHIKNANKIAAIKEIREYLKIGLKEAKELAEKWEAEWMTVDVPF